MGVLWEKLVDDPIVRDLRVLINKGVHWFSATELSALPDLLGKEGEAADAETIRQWVLTQLMADDPDKEPTSNGLGQSTQINLALFGATAETKHQRVTARRERAGRIFRPEKPVGSHGVRRQPDRRQPRGGLEWRVLADLRDRVITYQPDGDHAGTSVDTLTATSSDGSSTLGSPVTDENRRPARRLGDAVRAGLADLHRPIHEPDFGVSFFHRESTDAYVEQLAGLDAVTLFTGGAPSPDVHAPLSDKLLAQTLRERLRKSGAGLNDGQVDRVLEALEGHFPPAHLGSIARELVREQSRSDPADVGALEVEAQDIFAHEFRDAVAAGRDASRFLALGLGALAFALRRAGKRTVQVLTTNYDDRIAEAEGRVHEYFGGLRDYNFVPRPLSAASTAAREDAIPLYRLNGGLGAGTDDPLIVGEADSITDHYSARRELIDRSLATTSAVFVGNTLSQPDMLTGLVNSHYPEGLPRYTVLLAPQVGLADSRERARALNLAAKRYLHLGVVPIFIDFPHQAPQFLIEVALRLHQSRYASYAERLQFWWGHWAERFGLARGASARRDDELQRIWMERLATIREELAEDHLELPRRRRGGEHLQVEMWIRHPGERSLVLWATSDGLLLNAASARRLSIQSDEDDPVQRAFRDGTPFHGPVRRQTGHWHYQLSVPVVLRKEPWHHLPVGVVNILSTGAAGEGKLATLPQRVEYAADLERLTSTVKRPVNELLDPHGG